MRTSNNNNSVSTSRRSSKPVEQVEEEEEDNTDGIQTVLSKDGMNLIITVPLDVNADLSKTGKSYVVGTSSGFLNTGVKMLKGKHKGKEIRLSLNAILYKNG